MSEETDYQGWTNYETWHVNLMWTQDQSSAQWLDDLAYKCYREAVADDTFSRLDIASFAMAEILKDAAEDAIPHADDVNPPANWDFYLAFIQAGLSEVNWREIVLTRLTPALIAAVEAEEAEEPEE